MLVFSTNPRATYAKPLCLGLLLSAVSACGSDAGAQLLTAEHPKTAGFSRMPGGHQITIRRAVGPARCVDLAWNSKSSGTPVIFYDCHDGMNQKWLLRGDRLVTSADKCMEVVGEKVENGSRVQVGQCSDDGAGQKWAFENAQIKLVNTTKCLDLNHGNTANGTQLRVWECSSKPNINQAWETREVSTLGSGTQAKASPNTADPAPEKPAPAPSATDAVCPNMATWDDKAMAFEAEVLKRVNEARAQGADCRTQGKFAPHGPLKADHRLVCTARAFAKAMSEQKFFSHDTPDGVTPFERMTRAGVHWRAASENIADGQQNPESVVRAWLASDHHCADLMGNYALTGIGFYDLYWVQDFATEF